MKKNVVHKKLRLISGGVCAPEGFRANGVHCGIDSNEQKKDLALILADRRYPTACVYSLNAGKSPCAKWTEKHLKDGLASAILVNSGIANLYLDDGEAIALKACRILAAKAKTDANDTVIASTGKIGGSLKLSHFEEGISKLLNGLTDSEEGSLAAAEAIRTTDPTPRQVAYEFDLGDFPCKIGAIFKGSARVCPNMATTLAFLTTDVNITPAMLQKALSAATRDSFNLLSIDGISSPNDTVCIMASGRAGNYKISCVDTEYAKFAVALKEALIEICHRIAQGDAKENREFTCNVTGASSKAVARAIAKRMINAQKIKDALSMGEMDVEAILFVVNETTEQINLSKLQIEIIGGETLVLFDAGGALPYSTEKTASLCSAEQICIHVELGVGNFSATAFGCL